MDKFIIFAIGGVLIVATVFILNAGGKKDNLVLNQFAQCLSEKGVVMYGADWCPRCQNEKKAFGNSFQYVNYVECPKEPQKCLALGVDGYPTWIFSDGKRLVGEQGLEKLAGESGCALRVIGK